MEITLSVIALIVVAVLGVMFFADMFDDEEDELD